MADRSNPLNHSAYGGPGWSPRTDPLHAELGSVWTKCGINSEYAPLKAVLLHRPGNELTASADPEKVQMLANIDLAKAQDQHDALAETYRN
ncbi:MAG: amidinotransferase, partial [Candidatus Marinimicrobia bacterium]|nr:amidinotransferase [Candidatus Neomarinimicrobiota bacterium]